MKVITINAKCSDMFSANLTEENNLLGEYDGYVPSWFPNPDNKHFGDYVELQIDIDTGQILDWKKPTDKQLSKLLNLKTYGKTKKPLR